MLRGLTFADADWSTNAKRYTHQLEQMDITIDIEKTPDRRLHVRVRGLLAGPIAFREHRMPRCDRRGLFLLIGWDTHTIDLTIGGRKPPRLIEKINLPVS